MKKGSATGKILGIIAIIVIAIVIIIVAIEKANKTKKPAQSSNSNQGNSLAAEENSTTEWKDIKSSPDADITIYVGQGCPHCKKVEDYILEHKLDQKLKINIKEVWYNTANANDLNAKAAICKLAQDQIGVPFLFQTSTSKCLTGDQPVEDLLNSLQTAQ